jgi:hypothetical protein
VAAADKNGGVTTPEPLVAGSKNRPLMTPLIAPVRVILRRAWPLSFHTT